jgi:uncharacterized protein (UPF0335 family)
MIDQIERLEQLIMKLRSDHQALVEPVKNTITTLARIVGRLEALENEVANIKRRLRIPQS